MKTAFRAEGCEVGMKRRMRQRSQGADSPSRALCSRRDGCRSIHALSAWHRFPFDICQAWRSADNMSALVLLRLTLRVAATRPLRSFLDYCETDQRGRDR